MKRFIRKRWHGIPVVLMVAVLVVALTAGSVLAAYPFQNVAVTVTVEEAIALGMWDTWDNLEPYGSVGDVDIALGGTPGAATITITTTSSPYVGKGFTAGEWIVLPVNVRNGSDGALTLGASVTGGGGSGITLEYIWQTNPGPGTTLESGQWMDRDFKASGTWVTLDGWSATIAGNGGKSGSAVVDAEVLFVKISAPGDVVPGTYTFNVVLSRS